MEPTAYRSVVSQLADDLSWLEDHCRLNPELTAHIGPLRLASALARNVIGPFLEGQPSTPLHVAVVGGAGTGKSTVANFLAGAVVAETNPQAGYTRHPTAFLTTAAAAAVWPSSIGFLGPLTRVSGEKPADLDEDVYQIRRLPPSADAEHPLRDCVIWDCPDMTTWASAAYISRLLEVAAVADLVVYVASDERYNDEVPTQFLHLLIKAGKAVVVVLTKVREADAATLVDHFRREVLGRLPKLPDGSTPAVPVVTFPQMTWAERADPAGAGARHRVTLLNQLLMLCESPTAIRVRTVTNAVRYLTAAAKGLLEVARRDLTEFEAWKATVLAGCAGFEERYRREYLSGEPFRRFDRFRDELLDTLELPGAGRLLGGLFWLCRLPYRWTRDYIIRLIARPETFTIAEQTVLTAALTGWLDLLHAESLRRSGAHPLWKQIAARFDAELAPQARDRFNELCRAFELQEMTEVEDAGRELVRRLTDNPTLLYTLRGGKLAVDLTVFIGVIVGTWPPGWSLLWIPVGVSATHQATELAVGAVVERVRSRIRDQRDRLLRQTVTAPLADWLVERPATGGSDLAKLQIILGRVPELIRQIEERVRERLSGGELAGRSDGLARPVASSAASLPRQPETA